uniref:Putative secreted protein n=1 Tax=Ixodes ricinus TaxID=34613 RepID=A0A6B0U1A6_IXORI
MKILHLGHRWAFTWPCAVVRAHALSRRSPLRNWRQDRPSCQGEWHAKHHGSPHEAHSRAAPSSLGRLVT